MRTELFFPLDSKLLTHLGIPLTVVLEYKTSYEGYFDQDMSIQEIAEEAVKKANANFMFKGGWRVTDRNGNELPLPMKLSNTGIHPRETLYVTIVGGLNYRPLKKYPWDIITEKS